MNFMGLLLIAIGLSMDAFAVAICIGLSMKKVTLKKSLIIGLYFGIFQAAMPIIGYIVASQFADMITSYDHWIAFVLLSFLGGKMVVGGIRKEGNTDHGIKKCDGATPEIDNNETEPALKPAQMLPLAVATSIDALAVGVSFAFLRVNILYTASFIGIVTLILSMVGVKIGNVFGARFKSRAEVFGGVILILIGLKIFLEHA